MMSEQPIKEWQVVMAELKEGKVSIGVRFNREDTVHFFLLHKTPGEAAQIAVDIVEGKITLTDLARYDWQAIPMPYKEF